jgi:uncharacterized protein (TIGR03067 family)
MRAHLLLTVSAVGLLLAANAPGDDADIKEKEKLQGTWVMASGEVEGEKLSEEQVKKIPKVILVFAGEGVSLKKYARGEDAPPQVLFRGTFKLDSSQKPKTIDITITVDINENLNKGKTVPGIYELEGDTLKWCAPEPGSKGDRPKELATKPGTRHMLSVLKREKR